MQAAGVGIPGSAVHVTQVMVSPYCIADPNARNARGRTPLAVATSARFDETVALPRAAGAR